jgi:tetratricopeptide (TPR) repeat protein
VIASLLLLVGAVVTNQYSRAMAIEREFGLGVNHARFPAEAIAFLERAGIAGRAFNCLAMGGYLAWQRPDDAVFVDGRLEAFPEAVFRRYFQVMDQPATWPKMIGPYELDYALLYHGWSNRLPLVHYLAGEHGWTMVYYDEVASIFVPSDEAHRAMRERALVAFADVRAERRRQPEPPPPPFWRRALSVPVAETWRQRSYGNLLRSIGFPAEAAAAYRRSLALAPDQPDVRVSLGLAHWSLNQRDAAIAEWREVLRRHPDHAQARQILARATGS